MSVFGVDFGCRSCVIGVTRGGIDIICNEVSKRETSAFVSLGDEQRYIGESGLDKAVRAATNTVANLKRFIGMRADDPQLAREKEFVFAPTTSDAQGRLQFELEYHGEKQTLYPEQLLAMLIGKFRSYVSIETNAPIKHVLDCVLSVPVWYTAEQRKLVMQACEMAGANCMSVVNENTAALVDYGIFRGQELPEKEDDAQLVALIDIGYSATTVTIAKFWRGNVRVLAACADQQLGTRDLDYALMQYFAAEIQKKYKVDVLSSQRPMIRVLQACEKVKNMLSANLLAPLNIECIMDVDVNFNDFSRDQFEPIIAPLTQRLQELMGSAVSASGVEKAKILTSEMIGGGCRVPAFKAAVQAVFGVAPRFTLNASESIARGCTITAAVFSPLMRVREFIVHEKPQLPICIGLTAENPTATSTVSFLPEVNFVRTVLRDVDAYPKVEEVTISNQTKGFDAHLFFDELALGAERTKAAPVIASYSIGMPSGKKLTGDVTLSVRIHPSGLAMMESATGVETYEVEEVVEPKKTDKTDAADAADVAPQRVKKTKTRKVALVLGPKADILGLPQAIVAAGTALEKKMFETDERIRKTKEEKNALEGYIFENRPRIVEVGGMLHDFVLSDERAQFARLAQEYEEWLYDAGADASFAEYESRLKRLREIGEPAFKRHKIYDDMPFHITQFEKELQKDAERLNAAKGKHAHITDAELDEVAAKVAAAGAWAKAELDALKALPKTTDPTFTKSQLDAKHKEVHAAVHAILHKKAPPPPKKDEKKEETSDASPPPQPTTDDTPTQEEPPAPKPEKEDLLD